MGYSTTNGLLKSNMVISVPSGYMNLKITATDEYEGSYSFYKTMLVDSAPLPLVAYVVIYCSVGLNCGYSFSECLYDPNGDYLTYEISSSTQVATLLTAGFEFSEATAIVTGVSQVI
jgi:hypothetical protein